MQFCGRCYSFTFEPCFHRLFFVLRLQFVRNGNGVDFGGSLSLELFKERRHKWFAAHQRLLSDFVAQLYETSHGSSHCVVANALLFWR